jgi:sugar phosphate isomerase/epimerase
MNRRKFMNKTTTLASVGLVASMDDLTKQSTLNVKPSAGFSLKIFATNWGFTGSVDEFCAKAKSEGYDGIEIWWNTSKTGQDELFSALKKHQLAVGFLVGGSENEAIKHFETFTKNLLEATVQTIQKPTYINCHSGKDFFTYEENKAFIDLTTEISEKSGLPIYHETHRGRMLFAAHITKNFIDKNPDLRLTLDLSHWCNVHESLLENQTEAVQAALERTGHIHTRIGHEEGPQVNDPRAPEWKNAVQAHLSWWDKVVEIKMKAGQPLTMLTEFGPPNYLQTLPYTNLPVANQWEINVYMMKLMRERYLKK